MENSFKEYFQLSLPYFDYLLSLAVCVISENHPLKIKLNMLVNSNYRFSVALLHTIQNIIAYNTYIQYIRI